MRCDEVLDCLHLFARRHCVCWRRYGEVVPFCAKVAVSEVQQIVKYENTNSSEPTRHLVENE